MNKKLTIFIPIFLLGSLTACNNDAYDIHLTFGTLIHDKAIQITSGEFDTKMGNKENFLMAIYPEGSSCSCWTNFSYVLNEVVKNNHYQIYKFYAGDVASNATMKKLTGFYAYNDRPTFYILSEGRLVKSYDYSDNNPFYKTEEGFLKEINKRCLAPQIMEVDDEYLTAALESENELTLCVARNTCSDSALATHDVVAPFLKNHPTKQIYYFNIDPYRNLGDDIYKGIKDKYLLTTTINTELGHGTGYVPTYQHYKYGELYDMCVYLNDGFLTYNQDEQAYYATDSYYNETHNQKFHYLDDVTNKDLTKIKFTSKDIDSWGEICVLKNDVASKYHNVILDSFLKYYLA